MTPNWFATVALVLWPAVALWWYHFRPIGQATIRTILWAQLLLPVGVFIKLAPGIPQLDKISIPNLAALLGCLLCARRPLRFWHGLGMTEVFLVMFLIGPFITSELNGDSFRFGYTFLPSVGHYDALSAVVAEFLFLLPFFLGRQVLRTTADNAEIFRSLVVAGLIYSLPMLFEIRISPQLNLWIYGYFPSSFDQAARYGGFRPVVFLGHGLSVAFFTMTTVIAAATLWRLKVRVLRVPMGTGTAYLGAVLILCKSLGALTYAIFSVPLIRWMSPRLQMRVAIVLAMIAFVYPLLRVADLVPTTAIIDLAQSVQEDRATSLKTRFDQERQLLDHASQRFVFGWGRFGRNLIYDQNGKLVSTIDGRWISTLGQFGLFGFIAEFGLLVLCVLRAALALKFVKEPAEKVLLTSLAVVLAINLLDLIPNSSLTPLTWLLAGGLVGRAEALSAIAHASRSAKVQAIARLNNPIQSSS